MAKKVVKIFWSALGGLSICTKGRFKMKKLFLSVIIALIAISIGLYAQEKEAAQGEPKVDLQVVYEKTFDEPIVDVIFDTVTVSIEEAKKMGWREEAFTAENKTKEKVLISYPKVVFVSQGRELDWYVPRRRSSYHTKELKFYDSNGKIINRSVFKKHGEEYIYLSPKQKYILVSRVPTEWDPGYSGGTLYDLDGKKIWEIAGPTPIAVSDEGYAVAAHLDWQVPPEPGGDFYIYDAKGKLLTTIENPDKKKTAPLFAEYSEDSEYAILSFNATTYPPTIFVLITKEGRILWKKEFPEYWFPDALDEIDIMPNIGIVGLMVKGVSQAFSLDWKGNLRWDVTPNIFSNSWCIFSRDGGRVYIATAKGYLLCLNESNGEIIWMRKKGNGFTEMYEQNQCIVVKEWRSKCCIFDSETGKLQAEIEYPKQIFLAPHNEIIFIIDATNSKVHGLKIEEE